MKTDNSAKRICFQDEYGRNCIYNVPVLNQEKPMVLRMWVAYDIGMRCSMYDYAKVRRGYYLYLSFEEMSADYPARILSIDGKNCRVLLGEVKRKSKGWHKDFAKMAEEIAEYAIRDLYPDAVLDWNQSEIWHWNGTGSGIGMICDCYRVVLPKEMWLYGADAS